MDDESSAGDPSLDFLSPSFDPLKTLGTSPSKILLPCPQVQPFDNLEVYKSVVKGTRKPVPPPEAPGTGAVSTTSVAVPAASSPSVPWSQSGASSHIRTVLSFMQRSDPGPFKILQQCQRDGSRVRVWIRHCLGVRGVCEGVPMAYDQHMNLVLRDVVEHYSPFRTVANGGIEGPKKKKKKKTGKKKGTQVSKDIKVSPVAEKPKDSPAMHTTGESSELDYTASIVGSATGAIPNGSTRNLKQLFIRGDNILMVAALPVPTKNDDLAAA